MSTAVEHRFTAPLYELPSNYAHIMNVALDVPEEVSAGFGIRGHVPVAGTADGADLVATLVPIGNGGHRLFLNQETRAAIGKAAGESVEIRICHDPGDRTPPLPDDLSSAMDEAGVTSAWAGLSPSHRKEWLTWLDDAKRDDTRQRRLVRIVEKLELV